MSLRQLTHRRHAKQVVVRSGIEDLLSRTLSLQPLLIENELDKRCAIPCGVERPQSRDALHSPFLSRDHAENEEGWWRE